METIKNTKSNRYFIVGLLFVIIGIISLLQHIGIYLPDWIWEWHTFVLGLGLLMGYRKHFKPSWWILWVFLGGFFTVQSILVISLMPYALGLVFVTLGIILLFKTENQALKCNFWIPKNKAE